MDERKTQIGRGVNTIEEAIFHAASELEDAQARAAFLEQACGANPALRARIESLLEADVRAKRFTAEDPLGLGSEQDRRSTQATTSLQEASGEVIGRYKLLQRIGEGGMGVVYLAEQAEPVHRRVALKIIKLGMDTKQVIARFEAERQALAIMDHPNIARVLDAGATETGRPYFVMELVQGVPITEFCDKNQLSTEQRLKLFIPVCQAIQSAHQKGIIHRDLKPSNILVAFNPDGSGFAKVIDFGIAKATSQKLTEKTLFTAHGMMVGTPAYMSPEQAELSHLDVDTRTDIYSLGALLYELLTGTTPFPEKRLRSAGYHEIQRIILHEEPERPSTRLSTLQGEERSVVARDRGASALTLDRVFRGDLDWIVMKCLEKDRARRYETANGLAMDLQRHLENEPVVARPPSTVYRLQKFVRRNKLAVVAAAVVAATLLLGIGASLWETARTKRAELAARQRAYAADMNVAQQSLAEGNLGQALDLVNAQRPKPGQKDLRGWEWRYLWQQTRNDALFTLCQRPSQINSLASSPDGDWLAIGTYHRGGLSLWNLRTRRESEQLAAGERSIRAAFSPTQPVVAFTSNDPSATGGREFKLRLWNITKKQMLTELALDYECVGLAFSKDGRTLVTACPLNAAGLGQGLAFSKDGGALATSAVEGRITLWRIPDGMKLASYACQQSHIDLGNIFAATPDLTLAAYGSMGNQLRVIDLRDGKKLWTATASKEKIAAVAFSPDEKTVASACEESSDIHFWDVATGKELAPLEGHESWVSELVFWPDGKKLASSSADQTIRIWDVPSRKCLEVLHGHRQPVWALALLADGKTLVSGSKDGSVCFWDTSVTHRKQPRVNFPEEILTWSFGPDSRSVLTLDKQGRVTRWTGVNFQNRETLLTIGTMLPTSTNLYYTYRPGFSPDGRFLVNGPTEGIIEVWDVSRGALLRRLPKAEAQALAQGYLPDGHRLISLSVSETLFHEWDLATGSEIQSWPAPPHMLTASAVSPDAKWFMAMGDEGETVLRDLARKSSVRLNLDTFEPKSPSYSPDGRLFAAASSMGYARVWEPSTWRQVATLRGFPRSVESVAFSPDGRRLATGSRERQAVKLWDTESWQDVLTLAGRGVYFHSTAFSPDGNAIGSLNRTGVLHVWCAPSWGEIEASEAAQAQRP